MFERLGGISRHPIVAGVIVAVISAWLIQRCVQQQGAAPQALNVAPAGTLSEVIIHPPTRIAVNTTPPEPEHLDPSTDFNDWARTVRSLDKRYYEREQFLRGMEDKKVRWRGNLRNVWEIETGVGMAIHAQGAIDHFFDTFRVEFGPKMRTKAFSLHDGDLVEVTGKYIGEGGWGQPWLEGETLKLVTDSSP
jgi:hypothetical protein